MPSFLAALAQLCFVRRLMLVNETFKAPQTWAFWESSASGRHWQEPRGQQQRERHLVTSLRLRGTLSPTGAVSQWFQLLLASPALLVIPPTGSIMF